MSRRLNKTTPGEFSKAKPSGKLLPTELAVTLGGVGASAPILFDKRRGRLFRKRRSDRKLGRLTEAQRRQVQNWSDTLSLAEIVRRIEARWQLKTSVGALSNWLSGSYPITAANRLLYGDTVAAVLVQWRLGGKADMTVLRPLPEPPRNVGGGKR